MFWCYTDEINRTAGEDDENLREQKHFYRHGNVKQRRNKI